MFGTVVFSVLFYSVNAFRPLAILGRTVGPVDIALINSLFRVCSILILFPFLSQLEALTGRMVPRKAEAEKADRYTAGIQRLEERFLSHPALALEQSREVVFDMAKLVRETWTATTPPASMTWRRWRRPQISTRTVSAHI